MEISIFKDVYTSEKGFNITVTDALERIKNGVSIKKIDAIRKEQDKEKRNELKKFLPSVVLLPHRSF